MDPRSEVWVHFTRYSTEGGDKRANCSYCHHTYEEKPSINGTTSVKNHLNICIKNPYNNETRETQVKLQTQSTLHGKVGSVVNQMDARKACAYMIIVDDQPFSFVEKQGFRNFVSVVCPSFQIPSRTTVTRDCYDLYLEEKAKLKSFFETFF
ncbi:hypothetical protein M9H77_12325 [Catharanthus roseus]|uniref:Uncharacterized protein n=1 Tax=Catharanthus roseus TaxID=4058 RepID=A0ACC0BH41_CATRO|nr:hypothetical protein M9H77_12325 [Catharanthus roseus]